MPSQRKPAKKSASASDGHARRIKNKELAHGVTFSDGDGRQYILQEYAFECGKPAYFLIWDVTIKENPQIIGDISGAVSCARVQALVYRARYPETDRYPPDGIVWADTLKTLERPARGYKKPYTTYYVRIPKSIVQKFGIMIDDEVSVKIGDTNRANSWEEYYHVSRLGDGLAVILSKMARHGSEVLAGIGKGEHIMVEMRAHPHYGRRELGVCAPALWAVCIATGQNSPEPVETIEEMLGTATIGEAVTTFNDF